MTAVALAAFMSGRLPATTIGTRLRCPFHSRQGCRFTTNAFEADALALTSGKRLRLQKPHLQLELGLNLTTPPTHSLISRRTTHHTQPSITALYHTASSTTWLQELCTRPRAGESRHSPSIHHLLTPDNRNPDRFALSANTQVPPK